jgi:hypothetical protein
VSSDSRERENVRELQTKRRPDSGTDRAFLFLGGKICHRGIEHTEKRFKGRKAKALTTESAEEKPEGTERARSGKAQMLARDRCVGMDNKVL